MNDMGHIWQAVTPNTFIAASIVACVFAAVLWNSLHRTSYFTLFFMWLAGVAFMAFTGVARMCDQSTLWEVYIGLSCLWTWFIAITGLSTWTWRTIRKKDYFG
jgi:hypothetical protein